MKNFIRALARPCSLGSPRRGTGLGEKQRRLSGLP